MSGETVTRALEARFEEVRRAEVRRLQRKLGGLSIPERESAEAIIADVISALARVPARALVDPGALAAIVHLFSLDSDHPQTSRSSDLSA